MAENFGGMSRIIRHLEEEAVELEVAGLYDQADNVRRKLETYIDMRNKAHISLEGLHDDQEGR